MLNRPVFISGLRKSGTSMVRNLLDGHPELFVTPWNELHFFKFTHFDHTLMQIEGGPKIPFDERIDQILADRWFNPKPGPDGHTSHGRRRDMDFDLFKSTFASYRGRVHSYPDLFEAIMRAMAAATYSFAGRDADAVRFAGKGVQQTEFFPELLAWYPDIKFIYVLRNPYGQLNSAINNMRHNKQGLRRKHAINREFRKLDAKLPYPFLGQRLRDMKLSYYFARKFADLHPERFRILVYDRLLADAEGEMRKVAEFLEIDFDPVLLELTQCGYPVVRHGWSVGTHADNSISTQPLTAWKDQLPPQVITLVNLYFGRVLDEYAFGCVTPKRPIWRRFDRSERPSVYVANRFLYTSACRNILPR